MEIGDQWIMIDHDIDKGTAVIFESQSHFRRLKIQIFRLKSRPMI